LGLKVAPVTFVFKILKTFENLENLATWPTLAACSSGCSQVRVKIFFSAGSWHFGLSTDMQNQVFAVSLRVATFFEKVQKLHKAN